jgi:hypothetical protein
MGAEESGVIRYLVVSVTSGVAFGALDALINGNALARRLYRVYEPIARPSVNVAAGTVIDLLYGFVMAAVFLQLRGSLPGRSGVVKGLAFGLLVWFFRVVMQAASQWMTFTVPAGALAYTLASGLVEMLVLGLLYGATLHPRRAPVDQAAGEA